MGKAQSYTYILTNQRNTVLYVGVTADLVRRIYEHKMNKGSGFTSKYNVHKLVYFEVFEDVTEAIKREKQLKGGSRKQKILLIEKNNPEFRDLYQDIL
jgi:putative endonuclease